MVPLTNILIKMSHCHFPYPKVLGQLQFDDTIIKSSSEGQAMIESISFKGLWDRRWEAEKVSSLALRKRRAHFRYCSFLYSLSTALRSYTSPMRAFLLLHTSDFLHPLSKSVSKQKLARTALLLNMVETGCCGIRHTGLGVRDWVSDLGQVCPSEPSFLHSKCSWSYLPQRTVGRTNYNDWHRV